MRQRVGTIERGGDARVARLHHRALLGVGEDVELVVADRVHDAGADRVGFDPAGKTASGSAAAASVRPLAVPDAKNGVRTGPGHSTDTPMPLPLVSCSSASDSATTAYFVIA